MIDSHAHLIWESFEIDLPDVVERATKAGVEAFIHSCVHTDDLPKMFALQKLYPQVHVSAGVHPCDAHKWTNQSEIDIVANHKKIVAIGETGLDYYHNDCPVDIQKQVFRIQCQLAKKFNCL